MSSPIAALLLAAFAATVQDSPTRLIGRVLDAETNQPLAGVALSFIPADATARAPVRTGPLRTETDSRGVFTMDLHPGRYRVQSQRAGFIDSGGTITIDGGTVTVPDIRLTRGGAIEGRILGPNGRPMQGLSVFAVRPAPGVMREAVRNLAAGRNGLTDDRGQFRLSSIPPGSYYVMAQSAPGPPFDTQPSGRTIVVETFHPGVTEISAATPIEVTAGNTAAAINFQMQQATTVTVSGVVVDHEDRPVAGARVLVNSTRSIPLMQPTVNAQRDGTFQVALPPGAYRLIGGLPTGTGGAAFFTAPGAGAEITVAASPVSGVKVVILRR